MTVAIVLVSILPALLVAAAVFDLASYTIPNFIPGTMLLLFAGLLAMLAVGGHPLTLSDAGFHMLAGFIGLAAGFLFFALGWVGGGDAKLFAVAALWLGWDMLFQYAVLAAVLGGCLTMMLIWFRHIPLPAILASQPWLARLADVKEGVPYGVALALAALTVFPESELFRLVATS